MKPWNGQPASTGWIAVTTTGTTGAVVHYRVTGPMVTVRVTGSGSTASTNNAIVSTGGLPADVRPVANIWTGAYISGGGGWMGVNADGAVNIRQESGSSRSGTHAAAFTYPAG